MKEKQKEYYENNKEQIKANVLEWQKRNKDKVKKYQKKYFKKIATKINKYNSRIKEYEYHNDTNKRIKAILLSKHKQFLEGGSDIMSDIIGAEREAYKAYISDMLDDDLSWNNYGKKWQIRRIRPLKEFDLTKEKDMVDFMSFRNIYIHKINQIEI
jgi:hypothetical protein